MIAEIGGVLYKRKEQGLYNISIGVVPFAYKEPPRSKAREPDMLSPPQDLPGSEVAG